VELVRVQEWAVRTGAKVCIVFEGRDGAGKGGTIKAIPSVSARRSSGSSRWPAPTEREKSRCTCRRYLPHFPAAGEVVIFDRSWYTGPGGSG